MDGVKGLCTRDRFIAAESLETMTSARPSAMWHIINRAAHAAGVAPQQPSATGPRGLLAPERDARRVWMRAAARSAQQNA